MAKAKSIILGGTILLGLGLGGYSFFNASFFKHAAIINDHVGESGENTPISQEVESKSNVVGVHLYQDQQEAFLKLAEARQLDQLQAMRVDLQLSDDLVRFLLGVVNSRNFTPLVRNQAANILVAQSHQSEQLRRIFEGIISNDAEDPVFRDYSVQFLAVLAERAEDRSQILKSLVGLIQQGHPALGGTAALQVRRLRDQGFIASENVSDREIIILAQRSESNPVGLMGALSALAGTQDVAGQSILRAHLTDERPHIRRVAIAALAEIATETDRPIIERGASDVDPLVALAAQGAIARMDARQIKKDIH